MEEVKVYQDNLLGRLRVVVEDRKVWVSLVDVCSALGVIYTTTLRKKLNKKKIRKILVTETSENQFGEYKHTYYLTFICEENINFCMMRAHGGKANALKKWIDNFHPIAVAKEAVSSAQEDIEILMKAIEIVKKAMKVVPTEGECS